jgi:ProP effector
MTENNTAATNRIRSQLAERWPALFDAMKPVPLAIGIDKALLAAMPDVTANQLRRVLPPWCNRPRYLAVLAAGADRHRLEGVQGAVTEEQAADAAVMLKAARARFKEKNKARHREERAMRAAAKKKAEQAKAKEEADAEAKRKAEEAEAQKAKRAKPPPAKPKPAGPVIIVKKRRFAPPGTD